MTGTTFPPFRVEASSRGRMFYSSAGSARQAFSIAREELEAGASAVTVASNESLGDLLTAYSDFSRDFFEVVIIHITAIDEHARSGDYIFRLAFEPKDLALVGELASVAPITPSVPLVGRVPREERSC